MLLQDGCTQDTQQSHTTRDFTSLTISFWFFWSFCPRFPFLHPSAPIPCSFQATPGSGADPEVKERSGTPRILIHVPTYKHFLKLSAVYPVLLLCRRTLAEQTRPAPLGKHSIFYLNVKHRSCSLDVQLPAVAGWMDGQTAVPRPPLGWQQDPVHGEDMGLHDSHLPWHQHFCRFCFHSRNSAVLGGDISTHCFLRELRP